MSKLVKFLKSHKVNRVDAKSASHTCMSGMHGGNFLIPQEEHTDFYQAYVEALEEGMNIYLSERVTFSEYFHYFIDLDFSYDVILPNMNTVIQIILDMTPNSEKYIVSSRNDYKYHLNFPDCIVDKENARLLTTNIANRLNEDIPVSLYSSKSTISWISKILDLSVYRSGLRLLGSKKRAPKPSDKTEIDRYLDKIDVFNKVGIEPPFGRNPKSEDLGTIYEVIEMDGEQFERGQVPITTEIMEKTSIVYNLPTDQDDLESMVIHINPRDVHINIDETLSHITLDKSHAGGKVLPDELVKQIKPFITDHFKHQPPAITKMQVKDYNGKPTIVISLHEKYCPIKKESHKSNNQYIIIAESEYEKLYMEQRCSDGYTDESSQCNRKGHLTSAVPPELIELLSSYFPNQHNDKMRIPSQITDMVEYAFPDIEAPLSEWEMNRLNDRDCQCDCMLSAEYPKVQGLCKHTCQSQKMTVNVCKHGINGMCHSCKCTYPKRGMISTEAKYPEVRNYFIFQIQNNTTYVLHPESPDPLEFLKDNYVLFDDDIQLNHAFLDALGGTQTAIGHFLFELKKDVYRVDKVKDPVWYIYNGIIWESPDNTLFTYMSGTEFIGFFLKALEFYRGRGGIESKQDAIKIKHIQDIIKSLRTTSFQNNVLVQCVHIWNVNYPDFAEQLDTQNLFAFSDCIYDFDEMQCRSGRPSDYITIQSPFPYIKFDEKNERICEILDFINDIFPDPEVVDFTLKILSTCMNLDIRLQLFFMMTGQGGNGKSLLMNLLQKSIGNYVEITNSSMLTRQRENAQNANEALANLAMKRCVIYNEIGVRETINSTMIKTLSGGDTISTRRNHGHQMSFSPCFTNILVCNAIPLLSEAGHAEWRRIRVIPFTMKYVENPDPNKPHEKKRDDLLGKRLLELRPEFLSIMIEYYERLCKEGLTEPTAVLEVTKRYQDDSDKFKLFFDTHIVQDENGWLHANALYTLFKNWHKQEYGESDAGKRTFRSTMIREFFDGQQTVSRRIKTNMIPSIPEHRKETEYRPQSWIGYRLKDEILSETNFIFDVDD